MFVAATIAAFALGVEGPTSLAGAGPNVHVAEVSLVSSLEREGDIRRSAAFNHEPLGRFVPEMEVARAYCAGVFISLILRLFDCFFRGAHQGVSI